MSFYFAVKLLHVVAMTVLFGGTFGTAADIRASVALGAPHTQALVTRVTQRQKLVGAAGGLTMVTGLALVFLGGGLAGTAKRFWVGLALAIVLAVVGARLMRGTFLALSSEIATPREAGATDRLAARYLKLDRVHSALWLAIVLLMVLPIGD